MARRLPIEAKAPQQILDDLVCWWPRHLRFADAQVGEAAKGGQQHDRDECHITAWLAPEFASPASTKGRKQRLFRSLLMQNQGCALDLWLSDEQPGDAVSEP